MTLPVQPARLFVDREHVPIGKEKDLYGTPDLVMEIFSSSNPSHDRQRKLLDMCKLRQHILSLYGNLTGLAF